MRYYLDTSFLINFIKGNEKALRFLSSSEGLFLVPAIVYYEFLSGLEYAKLSGKRVEKEEEFIGTFEPEEINKGVLVYAAKIRAACMKNGLSLGDADYLIAAQVIMNRGTLVTFDRDFEKMKKVIPELKIVLL